MLLDLSWMCLRDVEKTCVFVCVCARKTCSRGSEFSTKTPSKTRWMGIRHLFPASEDLLSHTLLPKAASPGRKRLLMVLRVTQSHGEHLVPLTVPNERGW